MIYPVCVTTNPAGLVTAVAPDLPNTGAQDPERERALTKVHLRMEKAVSDLMIADLPVPLPSNKAALEKLSEYREHEIVGIDINPVHLAAVARHQGRT